MIGKPLVAMSGAAACSWSGKAAALKI